MKIESKVLFINVIKDVILKEGGISLTVELQVVVDSSNDLEIDIMEYSNIKFMGMPVSSFSEFKKSLESWGIDFNQLINVDQILNEGEKNELKKIGVKAFN
jgi:hypothetical protein